VALGRLLTVDNRDEAFSSMRIHIGTRYSENLCLVGKKLVFKSAHETKTKLHHFKERKCENQVLGFNFSSHKELLLTDQLRIKIHNIEAHIQSSLNIRLCGVLQIHG